MHAAVGFAKIDFLRPMVTLAAQACARATRPTVPGAPGRARKPSTRRTSPLSYSCGGRRRAANERSLEMARETLSRTKPARPRAQRCRRAPALDRGRACIPRGRARRRCSSEAPDGRAVTARAPSRDAPVSAPEARAGPQGVGPPRRRPSGRML